MDAELKAKWVKALRSGRYKQGNGKLKDTSGRYCCLGVLANIQSCKWKQGGIFTFEPFIGGVKACPEDEQYLRPKFAGGVSKKRQRLLADMNDGCGRFDERQNFKQIADYIERKL